MSKNNSIGLLVGAFILVAILAMAFGAAVFSTEKTTVKEVKVDVPVVNTVFVEKNVTVDKVVDSNAVALADAVSEYKTFIDDNNMLSCGDVEYSLSDMSQSGDIKEVSITKDSSNRHDTLTKVSFSVKNKFKDDSQNHACYRTDKVSVVFHSKSSVDTEVIVE